MGSFAYRFAIHDAFGTAEGCVSAFQLAADLALVDRHIDIASDLKPPCLLQAVVRHYRLHAAADERAFKEFAATAPARIEAVLAHMTSLKQSTFRQDVSGALSGMVPIIDRVRREAGVAVDSPFEVETLAHPACSA